MWTKSIELKSMFANADKFYQDKYLKGIDMFTSNALCLSTLLHQLCLWITEMILSAASLLYSLKVKVPLLQLLLCLEALLSWQLLDAGWYAKYIELLPKKETSLCSVFPCWWEKVSQTYFFATNCSFSSCSGKCWKFWWGWIIS